MAIGSAALAQKTIGLNRHHPGWYHLVLFHHHYRKGEYQAALQTAKKINMPEFGLDATHDRGRLRHTGPP
jgi:hypothetical protein